MLFMRCGNQEGGIGQNVVWEPHSDSAPCLWVPPSYPHVIRDSVPVTYTPVLLAY